MKLPIIVIAGATAVGKTKVAIELAKRLDSEIISADSMQVYKYMDIGTAKPSLEEMQGIVHHMISVFKPDEECSVALYQEKCKECLDKIYPDKIPIIAGGTGFYINAILFDNDFTETITDVNYRHELYNLAESKGKEHLHEMLRQVDCKAAQSIHYNNIKRVIRALEYYKQTGQKISEHNAEQKLKKEKYNTLFIILNLEREKLYHKINLRIDMMIKEGLIDEVENLRKMGYNEKLVSMKGIGYKEILEYLEGKKTLTDAVDSIKQNTRHYAKRQITWFKHQSNGIWIDIENRTTEDIIDTITTQAKEKELI